MSHSVICLPNVPDEVSLLASGIRACSAAEMPEVPQAWGLAAPARSAVFLNTLKYSFAHFDRNASEARLKEIKHYNHIVFKIG